MAAAAQVAGVAVTLLEVPGEHSWAIATHALAAALPWLACRTGILDPGPPPTLNLVAVTAPHAPAG